MDISTQYKGYIITIDINENGNGYDYVIEKQTGNDYEYISGCQELDSEQEAIKEAKKEIDDIL